MSGKSTYRPLISRGSILRQASGAFIMSQQKWKAATRYYRLNLIHAAYNKLQRDICQWFLNVI